MIEIEWRGRINGEVVDGVVLEEQFPSTVEQLRGALESVVLVDGTQITSSIIVDGVRLTAEEIDAYPLDEDVDDRNEWSRVLYKGIQTRTAVELAARDREHMTRPLKFGL
jgi:hypothetical protein